MFRGSSRNFFWNVRGDLGGCWWGFSGRCSLDFRGNVQGDFRADFWEMSGDYSGQFRVIFGVFLGGCSWRCIRQIYDDHRLKFRITVSQKFGSGSAFSTGVGLSLQERERFFSTGVGLSPQERERFFRRGWDCPRKSGRTFFDGEFLPVGAGAIFSTGGIVPA